MEQEIQIAALNAELNRRSQECFEKQVTIETLTREVRRLQGENERLQDELHAHVASKETDQ